MGAIDYTYIAVVPPPSNNVERPLNLNLNKKCLCSINAEAINSIYECIVSHVCDYRSYYTF